MKALLQLLAASGFALSLSAQTVSTVTTNGFDEPHSVAVNLTNNHYYISDSVNNRIAVYDPADTNVLTLALGFDSPAGIVAALGGLVVAENRGHQIDLVLFDGSPVARAGGTRGYSNGASADAMFNFPVGLAADKFGRIYIADSKNNAVRQFDPFTDTVSTLADGFFNPEAVAVDESGSVFVADTRNHVIKLVDATGTNIIAGRLAVSGSQDSSTGTNATFNGPRGLLWMGGQTGLLVSDSGNQTIRKVTYSSSLQRWSVSTFAGSAGKAGYVEGAATTARFNTPMGLARDAEGAILVADLYNTALRRITLQAQPAPLVAPAGGRYSNTVSLVITSSVPQAVLRFTQDGTDVNPFSPTSTGAMTLDRGPATVKVRGYSTEHATSATVSNQYSFFVDPLAVSVLGGAYSNNVNLVIATRTADAVVRYTLDGSEPTESSAIWTNNSFGTSGPFVVKAFRDGFDPSPTVGSNFVFYVATPTIFPGGGTNNNSVPVFLDTATVGADIYWTIDGSEPTTNSTRYTGPFLLAQSGTLKVKAFKSGFYDSSTVSAGFLFEVLPPSFSPAGATANNPVPVVFECPTEGVEFRWTIDGSQPTTNSPLYSGSLDLATNGLLKVRAFRSGFTPSATVGAFFNLSVATPVITPGSGTSINSVNLSLASATTNASLRYTLDGSEPTLLSPLFSGALSLTTNATVKVGGFLSGFLTSATVAQTYHIQVDRPILSPDSGFFPDGAMITLTAIRSDAQIHYTINGNDPTPADALYTGPFQLNQVVAPGADLRALKARAFAPNTEPSEIVSGQPIPTNSVGVPRNMVAGIGSTIVVPVVVNLQSNQTLRSIQFRVEVWPSSPGALPLENPLQVLNVSSNDFVAVPTPTDGETPAQITAIPYQSASTNGLSVSAIGQEAGFVAKNFAVTALLTVTIPVNANPNDVYAIRILEASGTSDGQQLPVVLAPLPSRQIVVSNVSYLVGDSSPGGWYNAGDFGNGNLDNADVNNAFHASLGLRTPFTFSDVFDAMDVFPLDEAGYIGGDGEIRYLDWQVLLQRSLRLDTNNYQRTWAAGGVRSATDAVLRTSGTRAKGDTRPAPAPGTVWLRQGAVCSQPVAWATAGTSCSMPVFAKMASGFSLAGLSFRAAIVAEGAAPPIQGVSFTPATGQPAPMQEPGRATNELLCAWSLVPAPAFVPALTGSNLIGTIHFTVPASAASGSIYTLRFLNVDGAPNLTNQYNLESIPASLWVGCNAQRPADLISEQWRTNFFGSLTNVLADAFADPDGDGEPNWKEYLTGTNPTNNLSRLQVLASHWTNAPTRGLVVTWLSAPGKAYTVERSDRANGTNWQTVASGILGDGRTSSCYDPNANGPIQFYRIRLQE